MKNIEIKARCRDLARVRDAARSEGAVPHGVLHQTDTYFHVPVGRLKLREIESSGSPQGGDATRCAELIFYRRSDDAGPKASEYEVAPVTEASRMCAALAAALGIWIVVEKRRELWILDNVRIHLDEVTGLGSFLELEAVVDNAHAEDVCHQAVRRLLDLFEVGDDDRIRDSYSDLLALAKA